jgi:hypothetical protein
MARRSERAHSSTACNFRCMSIARACICKGMPTEGNLYAIPRL